MKRFFLSTSQVLLFVPVLIAGSGCQKSPTTPQETIRPVKIFVAGQSSLVGEDEFPGRTRASQSAHLSFRIPGRLIDFPVRQGERVTEGQVVAQLDRRDMERREQRILSQIEQARAQLTQMRAGARPEEIRRMEAQVTARQAEYEEAQAQFMRFQQLIENEIISQQDFDRTRARVDVTQAALESARQELLMGQKGAREEEIESQEAAIRGLEVQLKEVQDALSDTELKAPFPGVVARTLVDNFMDVQAMQPILILQDLSKIDVVIDVSEQMLVRGRQHLREDYEAERVVGVAVFPALDDRIFPLRIKEFQTEANPQTQSFEVVLEMEQPEDFPVQPGMNAVVKTEGIGGIDETGFFLVPVNAVFADETGRQSVWVIDPTTMQVMPRQVETGSILHDQIQILSGLSRGEKIAASAVNLLRRGMKVEPMKDLRSL